VADECLGSFADIPGATSSSYTTPALIAATTYRAIVKSGTCASATSASAPVSVDPASVGGTAAATASTICSGGTATINLSSYTGSIQWQTNASGSFADIPGAISSSYNTPALTTTTGYKAIITSGACAPATSTTITIVVNNTSAPSGIPSQNFCSINNPTLAQISITGTSINGIHLQQVDFRLLFQPLSRTERLILPAKP